MSFNGSHEPGVCASVEVTKGLVPRTKCGSATTTQRSTIWYSLVTCGGCLSAIAAGQALVGAQLAVRAERNVSPEVARSNAETSS